MKAWKILAVLVPITVIVGVVAMATGLARDNNLLIALGLMNLALATIDALIVNLNIALERELQQLRDIPQERRPSA